jgi:hypothetical protein
MIKPLITAPLDPGFQPAVLFNREYVRKARISGKAVPLVLGLERECGLVSRFKTVVSPTADAETLLYVDRLVKFLLWGRGGWKLHVGGPKPLGDYIRKTYSARGARKFDCDRMTLAYGRKFEVALTSADQVPAAKDMQVAAGGHLKSCRIGFDLGYTIPHYLDFYDFDHMLILGRVTTGKGGDIVIEKAREVLAMEFPEVSINIHVPDEKSRRVGQAVAAASLPKSKK